MSNLRSDCRELIQGRPAGDTWKVHIEALCQQIDVIEESWHAAERKARSLTEQLESARDHIETIVEPTGEDAGVILLSDDSPTRYDPNRKCQVYLHENFSPLGDALVLLHQMTAPRNKG